MERGKMSSSGRGGKSKAPQHPQDIFALGSKSTVVVSRDSEKRNIHKPSTSGVAERKRDGTTFGSQPPTKRSRIGSPAESVSGTSLEIDPVDLVPNVLQALDTHNSDKLLGLLTGSIRLLKSQRSKPDPILCMSMLYLTKIRPNMFAHETVTQTLCTLLKREQGVAFKSKGNPLVFVLACNMLYAAHKDSNNWPDTFIKVYIEDALNERWWVDCTWCKCLVENIVTAFGTKQPPSHLIPTDSALGTMSPSGSGSPLMGTTEDEVDTTDLEYSVFPRYSSSYETVEALVLEAIKEQIQRRAAPDALGKGFLKLLSATCGFPEDKDNTTDLFCCCCLVTAAHRAHCADYRAHLCALQQQALAWMLDTAVPVYRPQRHEYQLALNKQDTPVSGAEVFELLEQLVRRASALPPDDSPLGPLHLDKLEMPDYIFQLKPSIEWSTVPAETERSEAERAAILQLETHLAAASTSAKLPGLKLVLSPSDDASDLDYNAEVSPETWLPLLPSLLHWEALRSEALRRIRAALLVECIPAHLAAYLAFLAEHAPQEPDLTDTDLSQVLMERTTVMGHVLPASDARGDQSSQHRALYAATLILHTHLKQVLAGAAGGEAGEAGAWGAGGERVSLAWRSGRRATVHVVVAHAHLKLLCYGPSVYDTNQEMYSWLQSTWLGPDAPETLATESAEEGVLLPDWLRLHLVRSARPALLEAGLRSLPAHKLALFIQTFGMPVPAMRYTHCSRCSTCPAGAVVRLGVERGYMAQLLRVQRARGATGGHAFAAALRLQRPPAPPDDTLFDDEPLPEEMSEAWEWSEQSVVQRLDGASTKALLDAAFHVDHIYTGDYDTSFTQLYSISGPLLSRVGHIGGPVCDTLRALTQPDALRTGHDCTLPVLPPKATKQQIIADAGDVRPRRLRLAAAAGGHAGAACVVAHAAPLSGGAAGERPAGAECSRYIQACDRAVARRWSWSASAVLQFAETLVGSPRISQGRDRSAPAARVPRDTLALTHAQLERLVRYVGEEAWEAQGGPGGEQLQAARRHIEARLPLVLRCCSSSHALLAAALAAADSHPLLLLLLYMKVGAGERALPLAGALLRGVRVRHRHQLLAALEMLPDNELFAAPASLALNMMFVFSAGMDAILECLESQQPEVVAGALERLPELLAGLPERGAGLLARVFELGVRSRAAADVCLANTA
ncbi:unnamed protein product [Leptidea sinapis]|uniref:Integrator complex subunit 1 INTS2-binding domain-containing protein n=1 Tax=Leptidea sinapis TaxID=189913 RepID=A0A5E4R3M6_9NEOP|nr:unnamed protein product [Leptidea sinapis]